MLGVLATVTVSAATANRPAPSTFVALRDVDPTIRQDIRYSTTHNFTGRPVHGYSLKGYTLKNEPCPDTYFDFPVRRGPLRPCPRPCRVAGDV
ncbi:hypothetical protein [Amycolatopsis minnesotensis]|uniref:Uncharacterized protein n=1 Tax=Amycolatopsis minnesotensis TaxID=337894 RepID=A0ABP5BJM0_9PSEU